MPGRQRKQPVLACARCYSLKKRCDRKLPCCSRCSLAGKECVGINRHSRKEVPRSALQHLEKLLAEIESDRGRQRELEPEPDCLPSAVETTGSILRPATISVETYSPILDAISIPIRSLYTTSCVGSHPGLLHESKLFYPTERPPHKVPVHSLYYEHLGKRAGYGNESQFSAVDALSTPFEVARHIFDNYVNTILPRYPCFTGSELWYHFGQVYSRQQQASGDDLAADFSRFVVSMVLAVSCLTSRNDDFARVASMSESLHRDAMRHWTFLRQSSIKSLQGLLLLIQLGFLLPYINNVFFLGGEVGRMAVGLGLHQEPDPSQGLGPRDVSLRRHIFWMVYLVDRTIAISTGSPPNISGEHITVGLPGCNSDEGTSHSTEAFLSHTDGRFSAKHFVLQIQLCQLQSEIYEIKFFGRAVPDQFTSYDHWVENMEERIRSMLNPAVSSNSDAVPQWIINDAHQSQNLLHRPHPGSMALSQGSLLAATTSAINLISGYHKIFQTQRLTWTFAVVNNTFQAAIVLLYIFGNYARIIHEASLGDELVSALDKVMTILSVGSQRWPVIALSAIYVKDLREVVFSHSTTSSTSTAHDLRHLEELELLLSQRRIRSIYQANYEVQPSLLFPFSSPQEDPQLPISDEMWQEFMGAQFELEEAYSLSFINPPLLAAEEQQQTPVARPAELTDTATSSALPSNIKDAIDSMPSCTFCRDQHVRCDRELPSCGACSKSSRECVYYDLMLSREVPRRDVHSLIQKLVAASQSKDTPQQVSSTSPRLSSMSTSQLTKGNNLLIPASKSPKADSEKTQGGPKPSTRVANLDYIFFGVSSHLALITSLPLPPTNSHSVSPIHEFSGGWIPDRSTSVAQAAVVVETPGISTASRFFAVFSRSVHVWYPIMTDESLQDLLSCCGTDTIDSCCDQKRELFYLVLAIASQLTKRAEPSVGFTPAAYFNRATSNADTNCDHSSGPSTIHLMQRSLLICIYLLLSPGSGDIWRNLGFAIRLYFDISHGRSENIYLDEGHVAMLARTLYCIEGNVTTAFGRPTVLTTGDELRYELTSPVFDTVAERISIQFYRISAIKMQLQSLLLSAAAMQHISTRLKERCEDIQKELVEWHQYWKTDFVPAITRELHEWGGAAQYFEAWGSLQYSASVLMMSRFSPETTEPVFDTAREVVSCSATLVRHNQRSSCAIPNDKTHDNNSIKVFPTDWTMSHVLFAAAIHLFSSSEKRDAAECTSWQRVMRCCLATLGIMEADPASLSMGFSGIVEELCNRHDELASFS